MSRASDGDSSPDDVKGSTDFSVSPGGEISSLPFHSGVQSCARLQERAEPVSVLLGLDRLRAVGRTLPVAVEVREAPRVGIAVASAPLESFGDLAGLACANRDADIDDDLEVLFDVGL